MTAIDVSVTTGQADSGSTPYGKLDLEFALTIL